MTQTEKEHRNAVHEAQCSRPLF